MPNSSDIAHFSLIASMGNFTVSCSAAIKQVDGEVPTWGSGKKQILLQQLTTTPKVSTIQEVASAMRTLAQTPWSGSGSPSSSSRQSTFAEGVG